MTRATVPPAGNADDARAIEAELSDFRSAFNAIQARLQETIVGQDQIVQGVLMSVFLGGHVLLEGVPGLGKTLLVTTLGDTLGLHHSRVQFTPDLMPADIIGTRIIKQDATGSMHFEFERGPVFTQLLLADEINRATPKTQSALLEAMQERRVTVAGQTYPLPEPFAVLATQNPLEQEGTYPLPEAQLDRFLFKLLVRFPTQLELVEIMKRTTGAPPAHNRPLVGSTERIVRWAKLLRRVPVGATVLDYGARLLLATHPGTAGGGGAAGGRIRAGASPRGLQSMILAGKLRAVLAGRFTVTRQDLIDAAKPCLRHRILLTFDAEAEGVTADQVIDDILQRVT
ncbi:MAG TPA: AAA family ATPase [Tepidisphaeraceae bacterium]|nr:AAA family ATPase [Tepidisphaeraceae bacterium]